MCVHVCFRVFVCVCVHVHVYVSMSQRGLYIRRKYCVFNLLISRWWRIISELIKSKSGFYQDLCLSVKSHSEAWVQRYSRLCSLWEVWKWMHLLDIRRNLYHYICICLYSSISIVCGLCVCVCVWAVHTSVCETHGELCSFGCSCMMDIWKLNWLMAPPSQEPASHPLPGLCVCDACVCVFVCVCLCGRTRVEWSGSRGTLHLASPPATDRHPCWTCKDF